QHLRLFAHPVARHRELEPGRQVTSCHRSSMARPMPHILSTNRPCRLQPGWYDVAVDRDLDLAGLRVVGDLAVLESRHEQITDGVLVAGGDAQRTCRAVTAS